MTSDTLKSKIKKEKTYKTIHLELETIMSQNLLNTTEKIHLN